MQNCDTTFETNDIQTAFNGRIRLLRLRLDGFVGNPRYNHLLQLSFGHDDVGDISATSDVNIKRDPVVFYKISPFLDLGFGQTKLPGNRESVNSSGILQLYDRT